MTTLCESIQGTQKLRQTLVQASLQEKQNLELLMDHLSVLDQPADSVAVSAKSVGPACLEDVKKMEDLALELSINVQKLIEMTIAKGDNAKREHVLGIVDACLKLLIAICSGNGAKKANIEELVVVLLERLDMMKNAQDIDSEWNSSEL